MMPKESLPEVPQLLKVQRGSAAEPTEEFGRMYRQSHAQMVRTFSGVRWGGEPGEILQPPKDPALFLRDQFTQSPHFEQQLAQEYFTMLQELNCRGWRVNEHKLYEHQRAHFFWLAASICTGTREGAHLLLNGPPGTGKTLGLGMANEGFIRWQMRQMHSGKKAHVGIFCTAKPTHMAQQAFSRDQRIYRAPPYLIDQKTIARYFRDCVALFGETFKNFFPSRIWRTLFEEKEQNHQSCAEIVTRSLKNRALLEKFNAAFEEPQQVFDQVVALIEGKMMAVKGIYGTPTLVTPPPPAGPELSLKSYNGDATYGIPEGYQVSVGRKEWKVGENGDEDSDPYFHLGTKTLFTGSATRKRMADLLQDTIFITCDETMNLRPDHFISAVRDAGGKRDPIVITATGYSEVSSSPHWTHSPSHTVTESIEHGVLPSIGFAAFPGADKRRYSMGTEEAWEQFEEERFQDVLLLKELGLKQPYAANTIVIAPTRLTREYAHRLERAYAEKGLPGKILSYDSRTPLHDRNALQLWFTHDESEPKILVASATEAAYALDLMNIECIELTAKVSPQILFQIFGRLAHSHRHHIGTPQQMKICRGYFRQQLFAETDLSLPHTLPALSHLPKGSLTWIPLHAILSQDSYRADQKFMKARSKKFAAEGRRMPDISRVKRSGRSSALIGTPLDLTAPNLRNPLEVALFNKCPDSMTTDEVYQWACSYHQIVHNYPSLRNHIQDAIEEAVRRHKLGDHVIGKVKGVIRSLAERAGLPLTMKPPKENH